MRITDAIMLRSFVESLNDVKSREGRYSEEIATGKKVIRPSDSPVDAHRIALFRQDLNLLDRYQKAVDTISPQLNQYDTILNQANTMLQRAFQLGSEASNTTTGDQGRQIIGTELRRIRDQLLAMSNTKMDNQYIFAGTRTNVQPFVMDAFGNVTYQGNPGTVTVEIAQSTFLQKNIPGDQAFMTTGIFTSMTGLITAVEANDYPAMSTALGNLSDAINQLAPTRVDNGSKIGTLEEVSTYLQNRSVKLVESISELEDADMSEVVTGLSLSETTLKALFSAAVTIGKNSLFNYIA